MKLTNGYDTRLLAAAVRVISSNGIGVVGRDGRARLTMEWIGANGELATLLREAIGEIPQHDKACAAQRSPVELCSCHVAEVVESVRAGRTALTESNR